MLHIESSKTTPYVSIPYFGLGTFQARGEDCANAVFEAIQMGYRLVDTAAVYRNEHLVAEGISRSSISREEIFITSKLSPGDQGKQKATAAVLKSLENLNTHYIDLYLIHWPGVRKLSSSDPKNIELRHESWLALQELHKQGKLRAIGVSNFTVQHLEQLLAFPGFEIFPAVNQVEFHPLCQQLELHEFCSANNIVLQAYSSLGQGSDLLIQNSTIKRIAEKAGKTPCQVLVRWALQKGVPVIPKSVLCERIQENSNVFDFGISNEDMEAIKAIDQNHHFCWDPSAVS